MLHAAAALPTLSALVLELLESSERKESLGSLLFIMDK